MSGVFSYVAQESWILIAVFSHYYHRVPIRSLFSFGHSVVPFSFCLSAPSRDAKPSVQLPDHSGRAAKSQPRSHRQPAKQYGQPDARHDGPVPSNAVLSGIVTMRRLCGLSSCLRQIIIPSLKMKKRAQLILLWMKLAVLDTIVAASGSTFFSRHRKRRGLQK